MSTHECLFQHDGNSTFTCVVCRKRYSAAPDGARISERLATIEAIVAAMATALNTDPRIANAYMGRHQAAEYLGISLRSLDHLVEDPSFPALLLGKCRRFRRLELDRWVDARQSALSKSVGASNAHELKGKAS